MLHKVESEILGVLNDIIGNDVNSVPALFAGVLSSGSAHSCVPHGHGELFVTQRLRAIERRRSCRGDAYQTGFLGFAAGRATKVEVAGTNDRLGSLIDELDRDIACGHRVTFAIQVY